MPGGMDALLLERIETHSSRASAALFGCAVGAAVWMASKNLGFEGALAFACTSGGAGFWLCNRALGGVQGAEPDFRLAQFEPADFEPTEIVERDELVLTDEDRAERATLVLEQSDRLDRTELVLTEADRLGSADPLVLDDILAAIGPESRVVRLFDRKAMPTPGQLQSRIDDRLNRSSGPAAPDASQELSDALAELRRSLR